VRTGVSNAPIEGANRIVKLVARIAYGFPNPLNSDAVSATPPLAPAAGKSHRPYPRGNHCLCSLDYTIGPSTKIHNGSMVLVTATASPSPHTFTRSGERMAYLQGVARPP